ncbi:MAG: hypothetical protein JW390_50005 [Nitrosopumilus sp.]|nr:hypothetical protein [Candidatus Nitrosopumilus limneticus]
MLEFNSKPNTKKIGENKMIQTQIEFISQKLETLTDVKFQNIIYYYWDGKKIS